MRLQLKVLCAAAVLGTLVLSSSTTAVADGDILVSTAYYKERATRVMQPMLDARLNTSDDGQLALHTLLDAITSASAASGAAGVAFTEQRYEVGFDYTHAFTSLLGAGLGARYSSEPDYKSMFITAHSAVELGSRNTTLGLRGSYGFDRVTNAGSQGGSFQTPFSDNLQTAIGSLSVLQLLSPVAVLQFNYDLIHLSGYQANPYRAVSAGGVAENERVPGMRLRHAVFASVRGYIEPIQTTLVAGYRLYRDDWEILAHTPQVRAIYTLWRDIDLHAHYRYHRQSQAFFYRTIYDSNDPAVEPFLTADPKLSALATHTLGVKADVGLGAFGMRGYWARTRVLAVLDYIDQDTIYGNAISAQLAIQLPLRY